MTTAAWIFLVFTWAGVAGVAAWLFLRVVRSGREASPPDDTTPRTDREPDRPTDS